MRKPNFMRNLIIMLLFFIVLAAKSQTDTIFTTNNNLIVCKITQTTSTVFFYSTNEKIKSISTDEINIVSYNGIRDKIDHTSNQLDDIALLKKNLDRYAKQKQQTTLMMIGGSILAGAGFLINANGNKYGLGLVPIGGIISVTGIIGNIDSYKFLRK